MSSFHGERASMSSDHRVGTRIIKWVASIRDIGITRDYIKCKFSLNITMHTILNILNILNILRLVKCIG